jgi:hypothetical protein
MTDEEQQKLLDRAGMLERTAFGLEYGGTPQQKLQAKGLRAIAQELKDRANNVKVGSE